MSRPSPSDQSPVTSHSSRSDSAKPETILGFDYGTKRIGVACGNTLTRTARAVKTLTHGGEPPWRDIAELVAEFSPTRFVVGLPYNMDGSETMLTPVVRAFASELVSRFERPVELVDERLSSREAKATLREARSLGQLRRKVSRADVDMTAAQLLTEQWLRDQRESRAST